MVTRYSEDYHHGPFMREETNGDYVSYKDYEKLMVKINIALLKLNRMKEYHGLDGVSSPCGRSVEKIIEILKKED